ncbi:MAG TPA: DUF6569 family protein [Xanthobacteraceae bacterium]|nr:DUF6569 family protein [Xanthobacteraceae bacterium]
MHLITVLVASLLAVSAGLAADDMRVSGPMVHDNLAIYLVHGSAAEGAVPLTLQEALARGTVKVDETGSVNELTVENAGDNEVFVQAGDIVKGGRQDRVLSVDLLLPPRSGRVSIAAFCVEQGRWSARGNEDARKFSSAGTAMPSQEARLAMRAFTGSTEAAAPRLAAGPSVAHPPRSDTGQSQRKIWATVKSTQDRLARSVGAPVAAPASPSSLQLSLESEKLQQAQAAYIAGLQDAGEADADIVGYVVAINGKIRNGDVYASNALFRKMWRKQLAASVTEAIGDKDAAAAAPPSIKDVETFLGQAMTGTKVERAINASVRLVTLDGDISLYAETRRDDGSWVHRNYLAK